MKYETEALHVVKMLDVFANRLDFMLKMTLNGRGETNEEELVKSVFQSVELIITSVQRMSFGLLHTFIRSLPSMMIVFHQVTLVARQQQR